MENPYRAPSAEIGPSMEVRESADGLQQPVPTTALDNGLTDALPVLRRRLFYLSIPVFLAGVLNTVGTRFDQALYNVLELELAVAISAFSTVFFIAGDVVLRQIVAMRWLQELRGDAGALRHLPTGRQYVQGLILVSPLIVMSVAITLVDLVPDDSDVGALLLIAVSLLYFVSLLAIPALYVANHFIVDQNADWLTALKRSWIFFSRNLKGFLLLTLLAPFITIVGLLFFCIGAIPAVSLLHGVLAVAYNRIAIPGYGYLVDPPNTDIASSTHEPEASEPAAPFEW